MDYANIVDPWATCFGLYGSTYMRVYIYIYFFFFLPLSTYTTVFTSDGWPNLQIEYPQWIRKVDYGTSASVDFVILSGFSNKFPTSTRGNCCLLSKVIVWIVWINTWKVPGKLSVPYQCLVFIYILLSSGSIYMGLHK